MPYLPRRRFRPAGTTTGRSPRSPAIDYTMPAWLRRALARGRDASGLSEARGGQNFTPQPQPPRPTEQPRDQGREYIEALTSAGLYPPTQGPGGVPSYQPGGYYPQEQQNVEGGGSFVEQLFSNLFQGGGFDLGAKREENRAANFGALRGLFDQAIRGFPELRGDIGSAFEGLTFGPYGSERSDVLDFSSNLFENIRTPGQHTQQDQTASLSRFLEPGQSVADAYGLEFPEGLNFQGAGSFNQDGRLIASLPSPFEQFVSRYADPVKAYYSGLSAPPPAFRGAGGGGGFGGFNFPESDPADPRFWVDMVRWLIE